jgi:hypothetical protein
MNSLTFMRWNRGDEEALQILEDHVRKVKVRGSEEEITEYKLKNPWWYPEEDFDPIRFSDLTACVQGLGCLDPILREEGKMKTMDDQPSRWDSAWMQLFANLTRK